MTQVVVVVGGGALHPSARAHIADDAVVVAADSGLDHALALGLRPELLVGDLDSISAAGSQWAAAHSVPVQQHPTNKDATDTELALAAALQVPGARRLLLLGRSAGTDERLDHQLGTLLALGHPALAAFEEIRALVGGTRIAVVHAERPAEVSLAAGATFSLLALHGPATGITLQGATWELHGESLGPHEARGISNIAQGPVRVQCRTGVLTLVAP
ncbi:MAG: thiamine diphosphokinase [Actinomycetota bacterium]